LAGARSGATGDRFARPGIDAPGERDHLAVALDIRDLIWFEP
jgi:hypothetical protein